MPPLDREIDRLYQLPLAEFTRARGELAKCESSHRAAITRLEKPNLPAWAVNQLYWKKRDLYDALTASAVRLRRNEVAALSGRSADAAGAEEAYRAARTAAVAGIRELLKEAGEKATAATLTAIGDTLDALPTDDRPGRLVRPLRPMGFHGLASLLKGGGVASRPPADVLPFKTSAADRDDRRVRTDAAKEAAAAARQAEREARRQADARRKEASNVVARLREAEAAERSANSALARAREALAAAERDREQTASRLAALAEKVDTLDRGVRAAERAASQAAIARADFEGQLKRLKDER